MARRTFTEYIELSTTGASCELEVEVEFFYSAASRGARENGVPMEPDTDEEVEIAAVITQPASKVRPGAKVDILPVLGPEIVRHLEQRALELVHDGEYA